MIAGLCKAVGKDELGNALMTCVTNNRFPIKMGYGPLHVAEMVTFF